MQPNPTLKRLGLAPDDRVVIFHADDIGMCHATVQAYADLLEFGLLSSASMMMPCPWALAAAAICRDNPQADMGVHLTLTCEWETYRWGPISSRNPATGLIDEAGFFHRTSKAVQQNGDPAAVTIELKTQIQQAMNLGIDVTHLDTHMGSIISPGFISIYIGEALDHKLPLMLFRWDADYLRAQGYDAATIAAATDAQHLLDAHNIPLLDHLRSMPLAEPVADRANYLKTTLQALPPGITHFIIHPAVDTPELRAIAPDWQGRVSDYELLMRDDIGSFVRQQGIHVIGYKTLRELLTPPH